MAGQARFCRNCGRKIGRGEAKVCGRCTTDNIYLPSPREIRALCLIIRKEREAQGLDADGQPYGYTSYGVMNTDLHYRQPKVYRVSTR